MKPPSRSPFVTKPAPRKSIIGRPCVGRVAMTDAEGSRRYRKLAKKRRVACSVEWYTPPVRPPFHRDFALGLPPGRFRSIPGLEVCELLSCRLARKINTCSRHSPPPTDTRGRLAQLQPHCVRALLQACGSPWCSRRNPNPVLPRRAWALRHRQPPRQRQ